MSKQEIKIVPHSAGELIIREGKAIEIHEPRNLIIDGVLNSPFKYLEKRLKAFPETECHVIVNRDKLSIVLVANERHHVQTKVSGKLELHPNFKKLDINTGTYLTAFELADLIKMNRSFFENQGAAMELVSSLKNFKAKVDKEVEKSTNDRGNIRMLVDQVVKSNLPEKFKVVIPLFKGAEKETIEVEINVNPSDLTCCLISPQANDLIEFYRDSAIDKVLEQIDTVAPNIVVFEI